jgi:hypothetical protein
MASGEWHSKPYLPFILAHARYVIYKKAIQKKTGKQYSIKNTPNKLDNTIHACTRGDGIGGVETEIIRQAPGQSDTQAHTFHQQFLSFLIRSITCYADTK